MIMPPGILLKLSWLRHILLKLSEFCLNIYRFAYTFIVLLIFIILLKLSSDQVILLKHYLATSQLLSQHHRCSRDTNVFWQLATHHGAPTFCRQFLAVGPFQ
jgi:uncharacterized membrane protein YozB (DUF420 family)